MDKDDQERPKPTTKRPYEPPRIEESAKFENLILGCGQNTLVCQHKMGGVRS
jgi:hypothetical protein